MYSSYLCRKLKRQLASTEDELEILKGRLKAITVQHEQKEEQDEQAPKAMTKIWKKKNEKCNEKSSQKHQILGHFEGFLGPFGGFEAKGG